MEIVHTICLRQDADAQISGDKACDHDIRDGGFQDHMGFYVSLCKQLIDRESGTAFGL